MFEIGDTVKFLFQGEKYKGKILPTSGKDFYVIELAKGVEMTIGKEWIIP